MSSLATSTAAKRSTKPLTYSVVALAVVLRAGVALSAPSEQLARNAERNSGEGTLVSPAAAATVLAAKPSVQYPQ